MAIPNIRELTKFRTNDPAFVGFDNTQDSSTYILGEKHYGDINVQQKLNNLMIYVDGDTEKKLEIEILPTNDSFFLKITDGDRSVSIDLGDISETAEDKNLTIKEIELPATSENWIAYEDPELVYYTQRRLVLCSSSYGTPIRNVITTAENCPV